MSFEKSASPRAVICLAIWCCAIWICNFGLAAEPPPQGPQREGDVEPIDIMMGNSTDSSQEQLIWYPDASFIMVHVRDFDLAPGVELTVSDHEELVVHSYPGAAFTTDRTPGKWALGVPGDTAVLKLRVVDPALSVDLSDSVVVIDKMAWGYPLGEPGGSPETVCGTDDRIDVECYSGTHPTEFERSGAVARLRLVDGGVFYCTAWRVGPGPHMMTNEHCITSQTQLNASQFWFNYERTGCGTGSQKPVTVATGDTLLIRVPLLDFALFTIDNPSQVDQFGYLELDPRVPVLGEEIYIPGHGDALLKRLALESDFNAGGLCVIDDAIRNGNGANTDTGYYCDSSGGQSGSPVLARSSHKVIALHHFGIGGGIPCGGANMNAGVRIDRIWPFIENYLGFSFEDGFESGDTSEWSTTGP